MNSQRSGEEDTEGGDEMASEEMKMKGWGSALRVVVNLFVMELVKEGEPDFVEDADLPLLLSGILGDKEVMERAIRRDTLKTFLKKEFHAVDVQEKYGSSRVRFKEDVGRMISAYAEKTTGWTTTWQRFEHATLRAFYEMEEAYTMSVEMPEDLLTEVVEKSSYSDAAAVRRAVRSEEILVFGNLQAFKESGGSEDLRNTYMLLENGMVLHYQHGDN